MRAQQSQALISNGYPFHLPGQKVDWIACQCAKWFVHSWQFFEILKVRHCPTLLGVFMVVIWYDIVTVIRN